MTDKPSRPNALVVGMAWSSDGGTWMHFEVDIPIEGSVRIGRRDDCSLVLGDRRCSRIHAELRYANRRLVVRDVASCNGTFVEGVRITEAEVREGSAIRLGTVELRIESLREEIRPERPPVVLGQRCPVCRRYVDTPGVCGKCTLAGWSEETISTEGMTQVFSVDPGVPPAPDASLLRASPDVAEHGNSVAVAVPSHSDRPRVWRDIDTGVLYTMAEAPGAPETPPHSGRQQAWSRPFRPGTRLADRYQVLEHLGRGGFSDVYRARDEENLLQDEFALKVPHVAVDAEQLKSRLQSQLKAWKLLSERRPESVVRLVAVRTVPTDEGRIVVILMEHMAGGSLEQLAERGWGGFAHTREQLAQLIRLFLQVCEAVETLHSESLLHRDLKPANMLLDAALRRCKLSDFELLLEHSDASAARAGTPPYMAPECFAGHYGVATDVFALGATLYRLLCGSLPFARGDLAGKADAPRHPSDVNAIVPPELGHIALRCLELDPSQRPPSVTDLRHDLIRLGLTGDGANVAPLNLARMLLSHLGTEDLDYLAQSLEKRGFRSSSERDDQRRVDLIEEYCYTAPPHEVLAHNCTGRQLAVLAEALGRAPDAAAGREELISEILAGLGFRAGPRHVPGIETTRAFLEGQALDVGNATTSDECIGLVHSGLAAVERFVDVLVRFYGQLLYGSGFGAFVSRTARGKPADRLTFGEKVNALRELTNSAPTLPIEERVRHAFRWPLITREVLEMLGRLVQERNRLAHRPDIATFHEAQRFSRSVLLLATEVLGRLAANPYLPRTVQIVARQDDVYGRHFYLGRDDRDHPERIFTPLPLQVGQLYLFFPLTNPARVNPLIYPYEPLVAPRPAS